MVKLPLATNARAKMQGFGDGFVKLFARRSTGMVLGGVVVAPRASELILGVSLAVEQQLTVDQMAHTFAVYPSLSGSVTEAARQLMQPADATAAGFRAAGSRLPAGSVRGVAEVGVVGHVKAVLAQPGRADVVGVGGDREDAAARISATIISASQAGAGDSASSRTARMTQIGHDDRQVPEHGPAAASQRRSARADPVAVLGSAAGTRRRTTSTGPVLGRQLSGHRRSRSSTR